MVAAITQTFWGCVGDIGDAPGDAATGTEGQSPTTAIPRLSQREVDATILDVFGIEGAALRNLPPDPELAMNPGSRAEEEVYDTLSGTKLPSQVFVDGLESLAFAVARDFSANTSAVDALAGCTPAQPSDSPCLALFIRNTGLRLWRRPLSAEEVDALVAAAAPFATDAAAGSAGHYVAVRAAIASLLVSPEFVYRTEIGTDVGGGVVALTKHELVARLSYFLWGTTPTPDVLAAADGELNGPAFEALVDTMLADPRTEAEMRTFHAMWLRYTGLLVTDEVLAADMRAETEALLDRALAGTGASWTELFTAAESFVTPELAAHYELATIPSEPGWVAYDDKRAGLLAHGSFLSLSQTMLTETLPSRRGAMIARRLLCQIIKPPPPDVAVDMGVTVEEGACKSEAYQAHRSGSCMGCHTVIDGVGFGFERFDGLGRYREVEAANPSCAIEGEGIAHGVPFSGPREFASANLESITACAVDNVVRFAARDWEPSTQWAARMRAAFAASNYDFRVLMRALALDPAFRHRVQAEEAP
jgi:hypothetical protein